VIVRRAVVPLRLEASVAAQALRDQTRLAVELGSR